MMISCSNKTSFKLTAIAAAITLLTACGGSDPVEEILKDTPDIVDDKKDDIVDIIDDKKDDVVDIVDDKKDDVVDIIDDKKDDVVDIIDDKTLKGTFVDSAVAGINYVCGDLTGVTDIDGTFDYQLGNTCIFKIGEVAIGSIADMTLEQPVVTPFDITEDDEQAIKVASLLQTIDADGNPENGIDLTSFDAKVLTTAVLSTVLAAEEDAFYEAVLTLTGNKAVTFDDARKHVEESLGKAKGFHSSAIEAVITKIEGISDVEQLDVESFLTEINTILETGDDSDNSDIEVLQAIISIFEIVNDPRVQARVQLTTESGYTKLLPQVIDSSMNAAEAMLKAPTNSTEDISGLFFEMSTRLAAASDTIGKSFEDPNYVANYGEDLDLRAESAYGMQAMALGYSSVLSYFSAYNYASDDHYLPKTFKKEIDVIQQQYKQDGIYLDQNIYSAQKVAVETEYTTADMRPDLLYKDNNFGRLHTDKKHLTLAKNSLVKLMEVGKKLYNLDDYDSAAEKKENIATADTYIAHLTAEDVSKAPINLGTFDDTVEGKLNLQAMYSIETALDRDDFNISASIDCGQLTYSEDYSKYENSPMCSSGTYADGDVVADGTAVFIYQDEMSYTMIYAVDADVNIDIEPKSDEPLKRFIPECMATEEDGTKIDCLDAD